MVSRLQIPVFVSPLDRQFYLYDARIGADIIHLFNLASDIGATMREALPR